MLHVDKNSHVDAGYCIVKIFKKIKQGILRKKIQRKACFEHMNTQQVKNL
ncbi:hypothetical protein [Erwinia oleae]|nr:hypothetical protein [Erwinia oleae]